MIEDEGIRAEPEVCNGIGGGSEHLDEDGEIEIAGKLGMEANFKDKWSTVLSSSTRFD